MMLHLSGFGQSLSCPELLIPSEGATDVHTNTNFEWTAVEGATGYIVRIGTSPGGTDILELQGNGSVTQLDLEEDLPPLTDIYISILPFDDGSVNTTCEELVFTTGESSALPGCATFTTPGHAAMNVSLNPNLGWEPALGAEGYLLTIGTTATGAVILDREDIGNVTNYVSPNLLEGTTYYVAIVPYNESGEAEGCGVESSFTTMGTNNMPIDMCTRLVDPANGDNGISTMADIRWAPATGAQGYLLTVGTTSGGSQILNALDVGNATNYTFGDALPEATTIYVTVSPYTTEGISTNCSQTSFTTERSQQPESNVVIPKFFTPNNDGVNDLWKIKPPEELSVTQVRVFDRYGALLKQMDPTQGWDGTFKGRRLPSGSYWYSVQLTDGRPIRGFFVLKR